MEGERERERERERAIQIVHSASLAYEDESVFTFCAPIENGCEAMANGLLITMPNKQAHAALSILKQSRILAPDVTEREREISTCPFSQHWLIRTCPCLSMLVPLRSSAKVRIAAKQ